MPVQPEKKIHLHVRAACIAKLTRGERNPSTPHPCTTAPSTRYSRGSASTVASAGISPASPLWPTHPGREASPDRKKRGTHRLAAAEHQLLQLAPSLFQRRRPIAVYVLYSSALYLSQPRRPIAVCWCSLDAHALCPVHPGVGRQLAPCLWLGLQQARWLGLRQARCGVVAFVHIPQEMRPLFVSGWR